MFPGSEWRDGHGRICFDRGGQRDERRLYEQAAAQALREGAHAGGEELDRIPERVSSSSCQHFSRAAPAFELQPLIENQKMMPSEADLKTLGLLA